jgi:hypothetical protein
MAVLPVISGRDAAKAFQKLGVIFQSRTIRSSIGDTEGAYPRSRNYG